MITDETNIFGRLLRIYQFRLQNKTNRKNELQRENPLDKKIKIIEQEIEDIKEIIEKLKKLYKDNLRIMQDMAVLDKIEAQCGRMDEELLDKYLKDVFYDLEENLYDKTRQANWIRKLEKDLGKSEKKEKKL